MSRWWSDVAEDNFNLNDDDDAQDNSIEEIFPNSQGPIHSQTYKLYNQLDVDMFLIYLCTLVMHVLDQN